MYVVEVNNLVKKYDKKVAVDGISFKLQDKSIVGFLGPNGAGKTTTINAILGLVKKNDGKIKIFGKDAERNRLDINRDLGYVPQELAIYKDMSALQNVEFFGKLYGLKGKELKIAAKDALEFTGLYDRRKDIAKEFSGGMQRRLNIACAIVSKPKLLIMDEPTVGVDPQSRNSILESIVKLNEMGTTILYTSHYMEEVEAICKKIYIMDEGHIIEYGSCKEIIANSMEGCHIIIELSDDPRAISEKLKKIEGVYEVSINENTINVSYDDTKDSLASAFSQIQSDGFKVMSVKNKTYNLENAFLKLTGKKLRD